MTEREFDYLYVLTKYRNGATVNELMQEMGRTERTIRRWLHNARELCS